VNTLAGRTSIGETMAAIAASSLVVANDSAATHMAVGFRRPLLTLFGPTDPAEAGPFRRPRSVVRSPAAAGRAVHYRDRGLGDSIMRAISVESVLAALDRGDAEPEASS
jgi:ADP-heptose:LPS heptosyltransferase